MKIEERFRTVEMTGRALFAASVHPRAIDYVWQAPVLALAVHAGGGALNGGKGNVAYSAHKFGQLCATGARLRDVLAAYDLPLPTRKLETTAIRASHVDALRVLARIAPSTLSQVIPASPSTQEAWLSRLAEWSRRLGLVHLERVPAAWLAVQTPWSQPVSIISDMADFIKRGDQSLNPAWSWARATVAMQEWHDRVSAGGAKTKFGVLADQIVCTGKHPDTAVVKGLEFIALRTPTAIHAEGVYMRHCVSTYVQDVVNGKCSIVSVREDERRVATLELRQGRVAQIKARFNRSPAAHVRTAANVYAAQCNTALKPDITGKRGKVRHD